MLSKHVAVSNSVREKKEKGKEKKRRKKEERRRRKKKPEKRKVKQNQTREQTKPTMLHTFCNTYHVQFCFVTCKGKLAVGDPLRTGPIAPKKHCVSLDRCLKPINPRLETEFPLGTLKKAFNWE